MVSDNDIEKYVLETYRPLMKRDGMEGWTALEPYTVVFRPLLAEREVWVEAALNHFCTVANGVTVQSLDVVPNIPGFKNNTSSNQPYYRGHIGGLFGVLKRKVKGSSETPVVRFGNAIQARSFGSKCTTVQISVSRAENNQNLARGIHAQCPKIM